MQPMIYGYGYDKLDPKVITIICIAIAIMILAIIVMIVVIVHKRKTKEQFAYDLREMERFCSMGLTTSNVI